MNTNTNYQNQPLNNPKHGELNENHGIAATGLNDPHTATAPFVQGNTGARRQGNNMGNDDLKYTGPTVGGNKLDQSGAGNTAAGISTTPGGQVNNHHQGLAATGNINEPRAGLSDNNYGNNMNDFSTHQPRDDVIHSTTGGGLRNNNDLKYSGPDTNTRNIDQTGGYNDTNRGVGATDFGTTGNHTHGTHTGLGNTTGTHTGLGNTTGTHTGTHGTHTGLGNTTGTHTGSHHHGTHTGLDNTTGTHGTHGLHTGTHGTHTGATTGATAGLNNENLNYSGPDTNIRNVDQSGDYNTSRHSGTGVTPTTHTGTTGLHDNTTRGTTGTTGLHDDTTRGTTGTTGFKDNTTRGHTGTTGDNTETNRHAGTGVAPVNITQTGKKDYDHSAHHHNTAPEGDHGASHHIKRDGGNHANLDEKAARVGHNAVHPTSSTGKTNVPATGTSNVPATGATTGAPNIDSNGQRHTGEPLHEGMGKVHPNREPNVNDPLTHGSHPATSDATEKASAGDKIKGNLEKMAGKITGNEAKVIKGENIAHGRQ